MIPRARALGPDVAHYPAIQDADLRDFFARGVIEGYAGSQPLDLNHQERVEFARSVWRLAEAMLQTREER